MDKDLEIWRKEGKHLPKFLRDFHAQKDFFRFLHEFNDPKNIDMINDIDWIKGQIYFFDICLWTLARYGWTLQKNSSKQSFEDLDSIMKEFTYKRNEMFSKALLNEKEELK